MINAAKVCILVQKSSPKYLFTHKSAWLRQRACLHLSASHCGYKLSDNLRDCYQVLRVEEDADDDELKQAYVKLAKEYHPDSGTVTADPKKFHQLQEAYRTVKAHRIDINTRMAGALSAVPEDDDGEEDIKHKAPQHRQYLDNEGIGYGTPSQRQRQYQRYRLDRASEAVANKRISIIQSQYEDALLVKDKKATKKGAVRSGMERIVEDLIQESMARGEFRNLPGEGKPLEHRKAPPNVDPLTYNLNKIVIDQGFAPEWVRLNGEISKEYGKVIKSLKEARLRAGPEPLSTTKHQLWTSAVNEFRSEMERINKLVDKLNLIAPTMYQQQVRFNIDTNIEKVKKWYNEEGKHQKYEINPKENSSNQKESNNNSSTWQGIKDLFSGFR